MHYQTIVLELLNQLPPSPPSSGTLLSRMETLAVQLRDKHLAIWEQLKHSDPAGNEHLQKNQALELAVNELQEELGL